MIYAVRYDEKFSGRPEKRKYQQFLSKRLLSHAVFSEFGVKAPDISIGEHGRPYFAGSGIRFSVSHTDGLVCCIVSESEAGVDAEKLRPYSGRLAGRICTPAELELLRVSDDKAAELIRLWTLKESFMKLAGKGISYGFKNAAFMRVGGRWRPAEGGAHAFSFDVIPGYIVSVCKLSDRPEELKLISEEDING